MEKEFKLKTSQLFSEITGQRDRWEKQQGTSAATGVFKRLTGDFWASHNCVLDGLGPGPIAEQESRQNKRQNQLEDHLKSSHWFLEKVRKNIGPTSADLQELHARLMGQSVSRLSNYRQTPATPLMEGHFPVESEMVPLLVENALQWFQADSFGEMHEVEQTALVLLKLTDIQPFERYNGKTLRLFSNFFLLRAGYPPAVIRSELAGRYSLALQKALCYQTGPLVELLTESVSFALGYCLGENSSSPPFVILD